MKLSELKINQKVNRPYFDAVGNKMFEEIEKVNKAETYFSNEVEDLLENRMQRLAFKYELI